MMVTNEKKMGTHEKDENRGEKCHGPCSVTFSCENGQRMSLTESPMISESFLVQHLFYHKHAGPAGPPPGLFPYHHHHNYQPSSSSSLLTIIGTTLPHA